MHRVTSAEALSTSAGHVKTAHPIPVHDFLPYISEALERHYEPEQTASDISGDVPLLHSGSSGLSRKLVHAFGITPASLLDGGEHTRTAWREAAASLKLSAPITVQALSQFAHILIIMSAVGRLGVNELAGIAVGWTWFNLVRCFCFGLSGAYDTLGSQAFGSGNKVLVLSWAITASFVMLLVNVPISVGIWHAGDAARIIFQQNEDVCAKTATFCRFMIPGLFPWSLVTILMKFLQVQGQMWAPALCTVAAISLHVPCTILLVHTFGFAGGGYAVVVMRTAHFAFIVLYLLTLGKKYTRLDQELTEVLSSDTQIGDEEDDRERSSHAQPHKSDSASSFGISPAKANTWSGPAQKLLPSAAHMQSSDTHMTDRHADKQHFSPLLLQQAGEHAAQQPQRDSNQSVNRLLEAKATASSQQLLPGQGEEDQWLLQQQQQQEPLHLPQQLPQQLPPTPSPDEDPLPLTEQDPQHPQQLSLTEQPMSSHSALLPAQTRPQQVQEQEQEQQDRDSDTSGAAEVAPMLPSMGHGEEWSTRQLVVYSLRPSHLWAFLGLGIPGGLASSVQSAAYEVTTAMAGVLGTIQIDAHTTMLTVSDVLFTVLGFGFSVGCTIRVGQLLGAQRPAQAKLAAAVTIAMGVTAAGIVGLNMFLLGDKLCQAFTGDPQVVQTVSRLAPLLAFYSIMNGSGFLLAGALKGMGRQSQLMWVGIAGYWGCGVPLGYTLAFHTNLHLSGLWLGSLTGAFIVVVANLIMLTRVDWPMEAQKAVQKQIAKQLSSGSSDKGCQHSQIEELRLEKI